MRRRTAWTLLRTLAVCTLAAACTGCGDELQQAAAYRNVRVIAAAGEVYLFARTPVGQDELALCLRLDPQKGWTKHGEFRADYSAVTYADGKLYFFLPNAVIELDADTCVKSGEVEWDYRWKVGAAEVVDGVLTAFAVSDHRLHRVWARLGPGGPRPDAGATATSAPARSVGREGRREFLAGQWRQEELRVDDRVTLEKVRTVRLGRAVWVFWSAKDEAAGRRTLRAAALGETGLEKATNLVTTSGPIEFTATTLGGEPAVLSAELPGRLGIDSHVALRRFDRGENRWLAPEIADAVANPLGERCRTLSAVTVGADVHLLLGTDFRILATVRRAGTWAPVETALAEPIIDWMLRHQTLLVAVAVVGLALLAASVIRSRFLPRRAHIADTQYTLASWAARGGAYACDLFITVLAVQLMHTLAARPMTAPRVMVAVFCFELFYFSVMEARSGKTVGKTLFGILVVSRNGGYPSGTEALLRNLSRAAVDAVCLAVAFPLVAVGWLAGSLVLLNTRGSQRTGDLAAGTYVVSEKPKT